MRITWIALTALGTLLPSVAVAQTPTPRAAPTAPAQSAPAPTPAPVAAPPAAEPAPAASAAEAPPSVADPAASTEVEPAPTAEPAASPDVEAVGYAAAPSEPLAVAPSEDSLVHEEPEPLPIIFGVMWDLSLPVGSTTEFTNSFSGRGFALDFRYWGLGKLGVGGAFVWDTMSDKGMIERTVGNATVSGVAARELDSNVLHAKVYVSNVDWREARRVGRTSRVPKAVVPYAAFGFGGARIVRRVDIGVSRYVDESWQWALAPEIGVEVPTDWVSWMVAVRYNYIAGSSDGPEQMFMNFGLGGGF